MVISIIFALGALHGFILAAVLAFKKLNRFPNRLLSLLMLVFSTDLAMAAFHSAGLPEAYPHFIGIDYPLTLLYGPLLFLYVKTLSKNLKKLSARDWLHFLPFLFLLLYMIPFFFGTAVDKLEFLGNTPQNSRAWWFSVINHGKVLHGVGYIALVVYYLFEYRKTLKHNYSSIEKVNLSWLQNFITGAAALGITAVVLHLLNSFETTVILGFGENIYSEMTLLAVTGFVYGIGYMGLNQPEVFVNFNEFDAAEEYDLEDGKEQVDEENTKRSYQKSGLNEREAQQQLERLVETMEQQKLYQKGDLNLADLAGILDLQTHNVTEIINRYLGKNFYDFVNEYRVEEVKKQLENGESQDKTLLAIALDAGFNSKSTFNSVFKKMTGMTPSEYRKMEV
ncbi:helix-turn-helix domain-containing protein [Aliifodinibius sp. S!AR15-10]|uniref:helix-turn-helix domain-containing protein n=1 Tax=Aliifodinibius sp. S!AR15-10 TaxID=2950437 RepID=UPI00285D5041|nr:helix-turn-helix domain-containing protein [Aliifodinibius sp. S!AR15-10]MDR8390287.1 helix-turn-helix domain-containing protein [Aliifodinibius sp. S!AR15-10]